MKKILLAGAALAALAASAQAADLSARRTAVPAAVYAPMTNWSGIYGGLQLGAVFGTRSYNQTGGFDTGFNPGGVSIGGQIGADMQSGAWVFGAVGDLAWTSTSQTNGAGVSYTMPWEGSARLRAGYLVSPQFLAYLTGGLAFGADRTYSAVTDNSRGHLGWTAGVGGEYMFAPNWSGFAEYRYTDLGYVDWFGQSINNTHHKIMVGVNYRFSTGPSAVVAKY